MIEMLKTRSPRIVGLRCTGKLHDEDYKTIEPKLEEVIKEQGRIRILAQLDDFHGWDLHAAWDDLKFGVRHLDHFEKVAMVGDKKWEEWMARVTDWFIDARVRYFDVSEIDRAWYWIEDDSFLGFH